MQCIIFQEFTDSPCAEGQDHLINMWGKMPRVGAYRGTSSEVQ